MNTRSIRFRLIAWYAGLLTVAFLLLGALLFLRLQTYLEDNALDTQVRRARQIGSGLKNAFAQRHPGDDDFAAAEVIAGFFKTSSDGGGAFRKQRDGAPRNHVRLM